MAGIGAARDADSFYVEDCRQVQNNTHTIQNLTGQISRLVGTLETDRDYQHCRKMVNDAVRQATETRTVLARVREHQHQATNQAERNNRRMMYNKLSDNLAITARVLEDVVRRFTNAEQKHIASLEEGTPRSDVAPADAAGGNEQQPFTEQKLHAPEEFDQELQGERHQVLKRVDEDMRCLQRIYTDLASAADEQQSSFDTIESQMISASVDIERGREQISMSMNGWGYQLKRRVMMLGGGVLATIVVVSLLGGS